ncbi:hypothetical protein [Bacillus salipaludis]|uniref:Uncharacterized protein n=1 Tax=Bacillus salipaludis TaxID=2547811 RepID=A0AA90TD38_9BACI|nr:hypothetical protein [Bacillus salipaludis]MDQ6598002.1 hypothetical protein [Bacillus salipaludis]
MFYSDTTYHIRFISPITIMIKTFHQLKIDVNTLKPKGNRVITIVLVSGVHRVPYHLKKKVV